MNRDFDVIVIGAGAVGENVAGVAARRGLEVAIVESSLVGGECSYWACVPSKTLLNPGKLLAAVQAAPGLSAGGTLDPEAVFRRRDDRASHWDDTSQVEWLQSAGVALIRGHGRLAGVRRVTVTHADGGVQTHTARMAVVVATGSQPRSPDIPGLDDVTTWDSREITSASEVPNTIVFIGGGTVGVEMAQAWAWLGAEVTLVHHSSHLLSAEEPFAGDEVQRALEKGGVRVLTDTEPIEVRSNGDLGVVRVRHRDGSTEDLMGDEIVVGIGRRARTDDLGLESVGLRANGFLEVDDHMRVTGIDGDWLYAVGDVNGRALLTHVGKYQARIAGAHIAGVTDAAVDRVPAVPRVIFTSPEVAAVGYTESGARRAGLSVETTTHDIGKVAAAGILGEGYSGTTKLVIDRDRQVIVGATFVGPRVAELLHSATVAIVGEIPLHRLWHAVPSFPTFSEVWLRLLENHRDAGWDPYATSTP